MRHALVPATVRFKTFCLAASYLKIRRIKFTETYLHVVLYGSETCSLKLMKDNRLNIQSGARKTGPLSRRQTWA